MFRPIGLFIGLRYTRAKKRNHFISFISMTSMFGIALGVLVLITVLSVMNGFDREIKSRVFSMVSPLSVSSNLGFIKDWPVLATLLSKNPNITGVAPFISGQVLITNQGLVQPAMINGVEPSYEKNINSIASKMISGQLSDLDKGRFGIILGADLADRLGVLLGDKVTVVTPQVSLTPAGVTPRFRRFNVIGIFKAGSGFGFDASLAFMSLRDAQVLLQMPDSVTGLHVNITDVYMAKQMNAQLTKQLTDSARISDWTDQFGAFFHAVSLEKTMMFFILLLIIAVAVFNLVSTLVMVVNEKEADIAILKTVGATPLTILSIFIVQGATIGIVGTLIGTIGGILLASNVTAIVNAIQHLFHVQFLSSSVYFVDYLPSELQLSDVLKISGSALFLSLLSTIYPALRAAKTVPVEALRYE